MTRIEGGDQQFLCLHLMKNKRKFPRGLTIWSMLLLHSRGRLLRQIWYTQSEIIEAKHLRSERFLCRDWRKLMIL